MNQLVQKFVKVHEKDPPVSAALLLWNTLGVPGHIRTKVIVKMLLVIQTSELKNVFASVKTLNARGELAPGA